jgi:hypothetical protein
MLSPQMQSGVIRLYISEGVPCAFRNAPLLYEEVRDFLAGRLGVHPKAITVVGSARMGYSLAPPPRYGNAFNQNSDLDLALVSESVFARLVKAFDDWKEDVSAGREKVRGLREERFWQANLVEVPRNIKRGFVDHYKIPNRAAYEWPRRISQSLWLTNRRLALTPSAPHVRETSLRVYRDWGAFVSQQLLNLQPVLKRVDPAVVEGGAL